MRCECHRGPARGGAETALSAGEPAPPLCVRLDGSVVNSEGVNHESEENRDGDDGRLCGGRDFGGPRAGCADAQEPHHAATDKVKPPSGMMAKCQAMMAEREKMMTDADQRLDDLFAKMNTASGMEKMAATATVVTEMMTQRRTMRFPERNSR